MMNRAILPMIGCAAAVMFGCSEEKTTAPEDPGGGVVTREEVREFRLTEFETEYPGDPWVTDRVVTIAMPMSAPRIDGNWLATGTDDGQVMLWDKKIQLGRETQAALDPNVGASEMQNMQKEVHRKEVCVSPLSTSPPAADSHLMVLHSSSSAN